MNDPDLKLVGSFTDTDKASDNPFYVSGTVEGMNDFSSFRSAIFKDVYDNDKIYEVRLNGHWIYVMPEKEARDLIQGSDVSIKNVGTKELSSSPAKTLKAVYEGTGAIAVRKYAAVHGVMIRKDILFALHEARRRQSTRPSQPLEASTADLPLDEKLQVVWKSVVPLLQSGHEVSVTIGEGQNIVVNVQRDSSEPPRGDSAMA